MDGDLNNSAIDEPRKQPDDSQKSEKISTNTNGDLKQRIIENGAVKCELQFREKVFVERPALLEWVNGQNAN